MPLFQLIPLCNGDKTEPSAEPTTEPSSGFNGTFEPSSEPTTEPSAEPLQNPLVSQLLNPVVNQVTKVCKEYYYLQKSKLFDFQWLCEEPDLLWKKYSMGQS